MTTVRQLIDAYAAEEIWGGYDCENSRAENAPKAFAALLAVLDLHVNDLGDCRECGVDATEEPIPWPCATIRAITTALEAK
jgi:hypothetical protein